MTLIWFTVVSEQLLHVLLNNHNCFAVGQFYDDLLLGVVSCTKLASFPGLRTALVARSKEREGPGMFPHMSDVEGRKDLQYNN